MTAAPRKPRTPPTVSAVRVLSALQVGLGLAGCVPIGLIALLASRLSEGPDDQGSFVVMAVTLAVTLILAIALARTAANLRRHDTSPRTGLIVLECAAVGAVTVFLVTAYDRLDLGGFALPLVGFAGCGVAVLILLATRSARAWSRAA